MFMQNIMLGLMAHGLGSCPQFSVAGYADIVRESLGLGADRWVVAGMSVGWPEAAARGIRWIIKHSMRIGIGGMGR